MAGIKKFSSFEDIGWIRFFDGSKEILVNRISQNGMYIQVVENPNRERMMVKILISVMGIEKIERELTTEIVRSDENEYQLVDRDISLLLEKLIRVSKIEGQSNHLHVEHVLCSKGLLPIKGSEKRRNGFGKEFKKKMKSWTSYFTLFLVLSFLGLDYLFLDSSRMISAVAGNVVLQEVDTRSVKPGKNIKVKKGDLVTNKTVLFEGTRIIGEGVINISLRKTELKKRIEEIQEIIKSSSSSLSEMIAYKNKIEASKLASTMQLSALSNSISQKQEAINGYVMQLSVLREDFKQLGTESEDKIKILSRCDNCKILSVEESADKVVVRMLKNEQPLFIQVAVLRGESVKIPEGQLVVFCIQSNCHNGFVTKTKLEKQEVSGLGDDVLEDPNYHIIRIIPNDFSIPFEFFGQPVELDVPKTINLGIVKKIKIKIKTIKTTIEGIIN